VTVAAAEEEEALGDRVSRKCEVHSREVGQ
jgi:hypothetical protein